MLRIALPNKGRLADETRELFEDAGLGVRMAGPRALTASLGGEFEAIFVRAADIPELVADGAAQAGITGHDLCRESERPLEELLDLGFGRCRLVIAATDDSGITSLAELAAAGAPRVATMFPRTARRYFSDAGLEVELVPVSGATEVAPHLGIADIILDLTSTGSTLRTNGLREVETVLESSARLVTSADYRTRLAPAQLVALGELASALGSVLNARDKRYLMANVPRATLDDVRRIVPGLSGPTVVDVLGSDDKVAVHAVVPSAGIFRTIASLKCLGAEGILVTRIERLTP